MSALAETIHTLDERCLSFGCRDDLASAINTIRFSGLRLSLDELILEIDQDKYTTDDIDGFLRELRVIGLVEYKRTNEPGRRVKIQLKRPEHYRMVEQERENLGYWGQDKSAPRYSICVCNYNMSDTLERAMSSVAEQLDSKFYEILIIDDGSSDDSLAVLEMLAQKYPHFRYISLPRDAGRRLGETRNISIRAARGEYVLIHIDADDQWEPYLPDFVTLFHRLEKAVGHDFLVAGQQTGMAKRDFLLAYGPYENVYRCEDRNLMMRFAQIDRLIFMDYRAYRTRLARPTKKKIDKIIRDTFSHLMYDMRQNEPKAPYILYILLSPFKKGTQFSLAYRVLRAVLILPIYVIARFYPPVINPITWEELRQYHASKRGTYPEIMERMGENPDMSFLSEEAQDIFSHKIYNPGFQGTK